MSNPLKTLAIAFTKAVGEARCDWYLFRKAIDRKIGIRDHFWSNHAICVIDACIEIAGAAKNTQAAAKYLETTDSDIRSPFGINDLATKDEVLAEMVAAISVDSVAQSSALKEAIDYMTFRLRTLDSPTLDSIRITVTSILAPYFVQENATRMLARNGNHEYPKSVPHSITLVSDERSGQPKPTPAITIAFKTLKPLY